MTKIERERYILGRLCNWLGLGWRVVDATREQPDGLIKGPAGDVGVELCESRQATAEDRAADYARALLYDAVGTWINDPNVNHWLLNFEFRKTRGETKRGHNRSCYLIPRPRERDEFVKQSKMLVRDYQQRYGTVNTRIRFDDSDCWKKRGVTVISPNSYPFVSQFVTSVRLQYCNVLVGLHSSSLQCDHVGIDWRQLDRVWRDKFRLLPTYRSNLPSIPIWLVTYNAADAVTRIIPKGHLTHASNLLAKMENDREDRYDEVLWGVDVLMEGPGTGTFHDLRPREINNDCTR